MSLDVMQFLKEDFIYKYEKFQYSWSSIDPSLQEILTNYYTCLKDLDIASFQRNDKDLLYDLNRAFDDCLVESAESLGSLAKGSFRRCKQRNSSGTRKILEDNLNKLKNIISHQRGSSVSAPHKPASIPLLNYVVHGFQDQLDEIVKKISSSSSEKKGSSPRKMCGVGIVGIGGSGKTTLASMVFNSREVQEKYQIMIWASLTSTLNKKESGRGSVFREILSGVQNNESLKTMLQKFKYHQGGSKMADLELDRYIEHFKDALKRNSGKYLIVLDDVWETEYWFAENEGPGSGGGAKCILSREWIEKTGGTVVVTSRAEEMAENIVGKGKLYMMLGVSNEACFDIFLDRVTKDKHFSCEDERVRKLKKDIEERCYGLPLAACTVADIIVAKHKEEEAKKKADADKAEADALKAKAEADALKAEAEEEADALKAKAEPKEGRMLLRARQRLKERQNGLKGMAEAEGEADALKAKAETEEEKDTPKAKAEAEGEADGEGEADALKAKAETEGEKDALKAEAEGEKEEEKDALKAEAEGEKDALKAEAEGEKDALKAEAEGEKDAPKAKGEAEAEGEADALKAKAEAEGEKDAPKAKEEAEGEAEREVDGAALEAKSEAERDAAAMPKAEAEAEAAASAKLPPKKGRWYGRYLKGRGSTASTSGS